MGDTIEVVVSPAALPTVMRTLREDADLRYEILSDLCGVDTGLTMQVVYHLWSPLSSDWLRVIADGLSREDPRVPSITFLWSGAEWAEREAYDMFGIEFEGNRDLRRIFMPPDYLAFPLRKDFALADDASRGPGEGSAPWRCRTARQRCGSRERCARVPALARCWAQGASACAWVPGPPQR